MSPEENIAWGKEGRWRKQQRTQLPVRETQETRIQSLGWEDPLEEGVEPPPVFFGESSGTEKPGGLQTIESQRVRHK